MYYTLSVIDGKVCGLVMVLNHRIYDRDIYR